MPSKIKLIVAVAFLLLLMETTLAGTGNTSEATKDKVQVGNVQDGTASSSTSADVANGTSTEKSAGESSKQADIVLARDNLEAFTSEPEADDAASTSESISKIVKYSLIGSVVLIPLVLLPVLFLFTRATTNEAAGGAEEDQKELNSLTIRYKLLPIVPGADPFLADPSVWRTEHYAVVEMDASTKQPFYQLLPNQAVVIARTGQLYDPASGLLFNPVHLTLDQLAKIDAAGNSILGLAKQSNLVFEMDTTDVYERTLALAFRDNQWSLARGPVIQAGQPSIRRASIEELPRYMQPTYAQLLANQDKPTASASADAKPAGAAPPKMGNLLVLSKLDFTKPQPSDSLATPRDSLRSAFALKEGNASQKTTFEETLSGPV